MWTGTTRVLERPKVTSDQTRRPPVSAGQLAGVELMETSQEKDSLEAVWAGPVDGLHARDSADVP